MKRSKVIALLALVAVCGGLFAVAILKNYLGLRTRLYIDTKIHVVTHPQQDQVLQRDLGGDTTQVLVAGRVGRRSKSVEVAIVPSSAEVVEPDDWVVLDDALSGTRFEGTVSVPVGWHKLFLRSNSGTGHRYTNPVSFGVGEVFVVAGQSNASGSSYTLFLCSSDDVRNGQFQEDGSVLWRSGDDPSIRGGRGSYWPMVGESLAETLKMPIGIINVAVGATRISEWMPGTDLFAPIGEAIRSSGVHTPRAVLWHQGESDALHTSTDDYYFRLGTIITSSREIAASELPWLVSVVSYPNVESGNVPAAQRKSWETGLALEGPDTDVLGEPYREPADGVHLNEPGTRKTAELWIEKIREALYPESIGGQAGAAP